MGLREPSRYLGSSAAVWRWDNEPQRHSVVDVFFTLSYDLAMSYLALRALHF